MTPEWLTTLQAMNGWPKAKATNARLVKWVEDHGIPEAMALRTALIFAAKAGLKGDRKAMYRYSKLDLAFRAWVTREANPIGGNRREQVAAIPVDRYRAAEQRLRGATA